MSETAEYQIVISWTDAEDENPPCYTVALYGPASGSNPVNFLVIDDNENDVTRTELAAAVEQLKAQADTDGDIDVEWDV